MNSFKKFVIRGDFSEEFLKSMGMKRVVPPLMEATGRACLPLEPIKLAYSVVGLKVENYRGVEQPGSSLGS